MSGGDDMISTVLLCFLFTYLTERIRGLLKCYRGYFKFPPYPAFKTIGVVLSLMYGSTTPILKDSMD